MLLDLLTPCSCKKSLAVGKMGLTHIYVFRAKGFEDLGNETGSRTFDASIEKLRANLENMDFQGVGETFATDVFATPGSPGKNKHIF